MPDTLEPAGGDRYPSDMESRVAVLEQIARTTIASLDRLERRGEAQAAEQRTEFRWLLGIMLGGFTAVLGAFGAMLGVMAHGFRWL